MKLFYISKELKEVAIDTMEHNGYKAKIMEAERLKGDSLFGLPTGIPMDIIPIQCLPGCPSSWVREAGTYVVPVDAEVGLWFDWTGNNKNTAIVPSVKGMNPITGYKIDELRMEQYRDNCPIHGTPLSHNRYCPECEYELPPQNYVAYPNTLWWDGFRQPDGSVRQFFFTAEESRDIASAVIGKENTVPAFGFAFFKTKQERFIARGVSRGFSASCDSLESSNFCGNTLYTPSSYSDSSVSHVYYSSSVNIGNSSSSISSSTRSSADNNVKIGSSKIMRMKSYEPPKKKIKPTAQRNKDVSIGAGARINQELEIDQMALEDYNTKPQGIIRIYFTFMEQLKDIVKNGGIEAPKDNKEGYLSDLVVG